MKNKYLPFAISLAVAILIVVVLVGCAKKEYPPGPIENSKAIPAGEIEYPHHWYITTIEDCKIYGLQEKVGHATVFFTKCPYTALTK